MLIPAIDHPPVMPEERRVSCLSLHAPGRLHFGFLDPSASIGRAWGSIGLVIEGAEAELQLRAARVDMVTASEPGRHADIERAARHLATLRAQTGRHEPLHLHLAQLPPAHAGFGSGTQLALAVGRAFASWHGLPIDTERLAKWLGRGLRSGIGIAGFEQGGLLVDGGPSAEGAPAPLLSRIAFPSAWRIVLVLDPRHHGLSGGDERRALGTLAPLPREQAADICHQVLMRVLPGAAQADFPLFAAGLTQLQQVLGDHFAAAQGGSAFTSADVGRAIDWLGTECAAAIGQSSWGPTGFAVLPSQATAEIAVAAARAAGAIDAGLVTRIVRGQNHGAAITETASGASIVDRPDLH